MIMFMVLSSELRATARVHPVHLMHVEWRQAAADPQPRQMTRAVSPPVGCQKPHPPLPFIIITQTKSWYSFYHPTEGRRLSRSRHCSKIVQPMPKAVYCSGFYDQ